jgi:ATP-binding protein involved in chromosome partitioning|tara:strand:- start:981 stop:1799 length:819 start_codon:yes stop_codon:yes gene_type:complete
LGHQGVGEIKHIVAVASGKGGVGKSTVSTNLAVATAQLGHRVGLLDADIYGPSQARLLGVEDGVMPDVIDEKIFVPIQAHGIYAMSMAFLTREKTPMVWRGPMASGALQQMIDSTQWGSLDVLFVDMPPGTGDIQLTLSQRTKLSGAVVVTTPQDIALIDARRAIEMFQKVSVPILGMVQNMASHICTNCGHEDPVFGHAGGESLADEYEATLLANIPLSRNIRETSDAGRPITVSESDGAVAALYRTAAASVVSALSRTEAPRTPTISMTD